MSGIGGKAFFIDTTLCIGCRGCQIACKQWNQLPGTKTENWGSHQNPKDLNFYTYKLIRFQEHEEIGYMAPEQEEGLRVYFCKKCMKYFKTVDRRVFEEKIPMKKVEAFAEATGVQVEISSASSTTAVYQLMNGYSDIASSASS